ncbi:MAG TPA: cell division protein FtsL [Candidatus Limnocylindria bacterium]|nr:cell division protein FtsL [Candidatus Limnocylindria bacterium]
MTTNQRLHRERDPRVQRSLTALALLCALLVGGALGVVGLRVQQVHLAYQLDALRHERARAETLTRQLEVEVATLRSPGRVEAGARQLGMIAPSRGQVVLAREFVAGSVGVAAVHRSRVAAIVSGPREAPAR